MSLLDQIDTGPPLPGEVLAGPAPAREEPLAPLERIDADQIDLGLAAPAVLAAPPRREWEHRLLVSVVLADVVTVLAAGAIASALRTATTEHSLVIATLDVPYAALGVFAVPVWLMALAVGGAYDRSLLGSSTDEYSKVATVAAGLLVVVCAASFLGSVALSRGLIALFFPSLIVIGVSARFLVRKALHRRRASGRDLRRVVVVGEREAAAHLNQHLERACFAGYQVVGAYVPGGPIPGLDDDPGLPPVFGQPDQLVGDLDAIDIDAIAVTGQGLFDSESLRSLAWRLHGSGIQLLVAPDLVDIAGPRIVSRPAGGLPMLLVEEPRTDGPAQLVKTVTERVLALAALALLSPVFLTAAALVKVTSRGPVLYRQRRVGRDGRIFEMFKFRSMVEDADTRRAGLAGRNEHDGPLFKIRDDPRVTPVGRFLRRFSLDELPQLWNVVRGDMAMIGPRPPLPDEVASYGGDIGRRLMVKPGITGLWQVSGRADLSWTEAVRLDLYYVENWSLTMDLAILAKTAKAVVTGSGAY
ncbi:MAG TPA: sugar transferase [Acidimicrobiales bacterium]|nr:sugar transferase [Acidimicrobiales bacterium]